MAGGHNIFRSRYGHGRLNGTHDGVDGGMQAERLFDDGLVQRKLREVFVLQSGKRLGAEGADLLLVQLLHDVRTRRQTEHDPRAGGRGRMLAGHKQSNHHVGNLVVRNRLSALVA